MEFEKIHCQLCQDVGLCTFCERGQLAISEYQKNKSNDTEVKDEDDKKDGGIEVKNNIISQEERPDPWEDLGYKRK